MASPAVLLVDDDASFARSLRSYAKAKGCDVTIAPTLRHAESRLESSESLDLIILDVGLPDGCGLDLIERMPFNALKHLVVLTGDPCAETARRAHQFPIMDYMVKPLKQHRLDGLFVRASANARARSALLPDQVPCGALLGQSFCMRQARTALQRIAPYEDTVLLTGPSGTGKELAAQAIHQLSGRTGRFVPVNCGASSAELLGSHLFGHERGSFTGAVREHRGYLEQANGGTLFLDEITEMPLDLQPYLLRVLESRTVTSLGSTESRPVDARIIAACNVDPLRSVENGRLRADLYYRLAQFPIQMPSLAERLDDVVYLAQEFLDTLNDAHLTSCQFSDAALEALKERAWPGNVRELKHTVRRAYILADGDLIDIADVAEVKVLWAGAADDMHSGRLEEIERHAILRALKKNGNNKTLAAHELGISVKTIYNKLERYQTRP